MESIAKRGDTTVPALMMENNLVNQKLKRGQKLLLPQPQHLLLQLRRGQLVSV